MWIGFNQAGATGVCRAPGFGSRYVANQYRPSANSMMNSLFGNNVNTSFNAVVARADGHVHLARREADRLDRAGGGRRDQPGACSR